MNILLNAANVIKVAGKDSGWGISDGVLAGSSPPLLLPSLHVG